MIFAKWGCDNSSTPICSASLGSRSHNIYALERRRRRRKKKKQKRVETMPCVYISTNVCLDGLDLEPIFADATKAVAAIIGRPENFVMVILKGSLAISFGGNKEPAAYTEIVAMGGINTQVKRELIATLGGILHERLSIPPARFFLKVYDTTALAIPKL